MPSPANEAKCLSALAKPEKIQVDELVWHVKATSAARSPLHSTQKGKAKFTFNVAKCDKIFDELFKNGNIKLSHIIPPLEELKKCVYCKRHGSFLHNTNNCNIFRRQIQSVVDEVSHPGFGAPRPWREQSPGVLGPSLTHMMNHGT
jgi:hypothetical protein